MSEPLITCVGISLFGVFIGGISQVLLKLSAVKKHCNRVAEYINPLVMGAYALFIASTLLSTLAYRVVPLSMGPILDATGYIYVTVFGVFIFHERLDRRKVIALGLILTGIVIYSFGL